MPANIEDANGAPAAAEALPLVPKPAVARCLGTVEIAELTGLVRRLSEKTWRQEDACKENNYFCFDHTQHIIFRFITGNVNPWRHYSTFAWKAWRRVLMPVMVEAAAAYGYRRPIYPKAMLARLKAGQRIGLHEDGEGAHPLTHRIHVPVITNPGVTFTIGAARRHFPAGFAYEVNNLVAHGVCNAGAEDRVHLIFEVFDGRGDAASESFAA